MSTLNNSDLFVVQRPSGGSAGTYKIEWKNILGNIAGASGVNFKGTADFTNVAQDPSLVSRSNGDMWINTTAGTFAWANPETSNKAVEVGDYCIWDSADGVWRFIGSLDGGGGGGAVASVDATAPLAMNGNATTGDVVVESREASTSQSGHVMRLATSTDVSNKQAGPVVDAQLLETYIGQISGGVSDIGNVNPKDSDTLSFWKPWNNTADSALYVYTNDSDPNKKDLAIKYSTETQAGVSYVTPAGTNAVIDFSGAETDNGHPGAKLDNLGMMTCKRTYANFVPRTFNELNSLPT